MRRRLTSLLLALAGFALLTAPAAAPAAKRTVKRPAITRVTPMRLTVGETLTLRGRNFSPRRTRNTVVFRAPNGRSVFAKPSRASSRKLVLRVPAAVTRILEPGPNRIRLRVLSRRFSSFTSPRLSPVLVAAGSRPGSPGTPVAPGSPGSPVAPGAPVTVRDCTPGDFDGDLLPGAQEATLRTDPCVKDTDGDGVEDGFEYRSAVDLNDDEFQSPNTSLPYPGKRPYPNPLDPSDAKTSYDGDTLSQLEEQALWEYAVSQGAARTLSPLEYSDGEQYSKLTRGSDGHRVPTLAAVGYTKSQSFKSWASANGYDPVELSDGAPWYSGAARSSYSLFDFNRSGTATAAELVYYDFDGNGYLSDDERDEDADGLTNSDETHGRATRAYWTSCYRGEKPYVVTYADPSPVDSDSDGDGVRDGADDQDHDDLPNLSELSRFAASGIDDTKSGARLPCTPADGLPVSNHASAYGRVNPFNPCLPATWSRTCPRFVNEGTGAPFDGSPDWLSLN